MQITGPKSKKELRTLYNVCDETFSKWLKKIPDLNAFKSQRIFTPAQVQLIITHLGQP